MSARDPRIDAYIDKAAPFACPILREIREAVHAASPDIQETIKWGFPHFTYKGIVCSMAAFKEHCTFGFWKGSLLKKSEDTKEGEAMGQFGRIGTLADLPSRETITELVRDAVRLNEEGVKVPRIPSSPAPVESPIPESFRHALAAHPEAKAAFERLSPSHRREYVEWISEAKREDTRLRRVQTAVEWISQGRSRNWKYMK